MENSQDAASGPTQRAVEIGVAASVALFALIVIVGSLQAGIGWGAEGPKAGFFPFCVGVLILISSAVNLLHIGRHGAAGGLFAEWRPLSKVMAMLVPTAIYVALIPWVGIYIASVLLIAAFMRGLGRYGWSMVAAVALGVPVTTFLVFDGWFLLPLPKGPIEAFSRFLGLGKAPSVLG